MSMFPPPPPPDDALHIASVAAEITKLNVKIPIEDLIKAIHDADEAKRIEATAEAIRRRAALFERKSAPHTLPAL